MLKAEKPTLFTLPYIMYSGYYLMIDNKGHSQYI
jgi:hypothetical protein